MSFRRSNVLAHVALGAVLSLSWTAVPPAWAGDKIDFSSAAAPLPVPHVKNAVARSGSGLAGLAVVQPVALEGTVPGDKIEFSDASSGLAVPQLEREIKDSAPSQGPVMASIPSYEETLFPPPSEMVLVAPSRDKRHSLESDFNDSMDNQDDPYGLKNDPYARADSFNSISNRWSMQRAWAPAPANPLIRRRTDDGEVNAFRSRMDSLTDSTRDRAFGDERSSDTTDFDQNSAWARAFPHAFPSLDRMRSGQFMAMDAEAKSAGETRTSSLASRLAFDRDARSDYATPSAASDYTSTFGPRGQDDVMAAPRFSHSSENRAARQNYGGYGSSPDSSATRGAAPTRPAVLQFPKKPGSVFQ